MRPYRDRTAPGAVRSATPPALLRRGVPRRPARSRDVWARAALFGVVSLLATGCDEPEPAPEATADPPGQAQEIEADRREPSEPSAVEAAEAEPSDDGAPEVATIGRPAPDFTLTDQAGVEHRLAQYRGRVVVLEWINPGCPYVQRHYRAGTMTTLERSFPDERVVWLAIDSSNFVQPADSQEWREEHEIAYPILQDPEGIVGRRYAARTTPHMYVVDAEGTLRYAGAIDDDPRGRTDAPTNHVQAAVRALLDGEAVPVQSTEPYGCTVKYEGV